MRNTKTRKMILNAILLGIGLLLHQIFPAIGGGITPDITLVMLFCIMIINKDDYKSCLVAGLITGLFTAMTTKFPGGQIPNFIDKAVTVNVMFVVMKALFATPFVSKMGKKANQFVILAMTFIGTMVSGFVFLAIASLMVGLPDSLVQLFIIVVLPSIVINLITAAVIYNVISLSLKRTSYQIG